MKEESELKEIKGQESMVVAQLGPVALKFPKEPVSQPRPHRQVAFPLSVWMAIPAKEEKRAVLFLGQSHLGLCILFALHLH